MEKKCIALSMKNRKKMEQIYKEMRRDREIERKKSFDVKNEEQKEKRIDRNTCKSEERNRE